ncbi:MAG TPA: zinc ABC transporter substrate-binding protein [Chromatiales bacterium]|nr:zinc ABC transporter substrate-binding protein [Thiotrichales bacterium]HIP67143.1 zinc ABC transporter substrate-binding protein [Chromatiales bacterium]
MSIRLKKSVWLCVLLLSLCSNSVVARINVFACEPEWAALTRTLGGNAVEVYSATTAQQDPHHIQARPSLIARVRRADLLVCTGAELELGWLPLLLRKSGNGNIQPNAQGHFMAADHITLLEKPAVLDRSLGDIHAAGNPHFHFDPYRILQIARALTTRLTKIDPANSDLYQKNGMDFSQKWNQAIQKWEQEFKALQGKRIVVSHNNWVYLEQWLGLKRVATLEPKPGIPPTSAHLSKMLARLKQNPADMILYANYQNDKSARWLSQKTGIPVIGLPFSVSEKESLMQWFERFLNQLLSAGS